MSPDPTGSRAVLRAFARLAGDEDRTVPLDVSATGDPIAWLGESPWPAPGTPSGRFGVPGSVVVSGSPALSRLAAIDALAPGTRLLRAGWCWVVGRRPPSDGEAAVLAPLLTQPVEVARVGVTILTAVGDLELTPLIDDPDLRSALDPLARLYPPAHRSGTPPPAFSQHPGLLQWCADAAAAAGLRADRLLDAASDPRGRRGGDALDVWAGCAIFASRTDLELDLGSVLRTWASRADLEQSALARVHAGAPDEAPPLDPTAPVHSPLPLHAEQRAVIRHVRANDVTVVSGAPGTGKSHTVVATAIDAVARGRSVLVATQSPHASDVLADLLARHPGPVPVLFGSSARRDDVAGELASGLGPALTGAELHVRRRTVDDAAARVAWVEHAIVLQLQREAVVSSSATREELVATLQLDLPGAFDPSTDLAAARQLLDVLARPAGGWLERRRRRHVAADLGAMLRIEGEIDVAQAGLALEVAAARRAELELEVVGGTTVVGLWDELERADRDLSAAVGALAADLARGAAARNQHARAAVAALATALRSGRERRRLMLEQVDGRRLLEALPLWVGTLRDIEELLPTTAGLFDLVVLDEASQIDQLRAVSALARGRRAMIVGDPRQLRHASFVSDAAVTEALDAEGLGDRAGLLDVRRNSAFDLAAGVHPVLELVAEHRSAPHLIRFPVERFYRRELQLATRHPRNEARDCIDVVRVAGRRGADRANHEEAAAVLGVVDELVRGGCRSIAVISPFRAQADTIRAAVLDRWEPGELVGLGLRVGTVHEFQGSERDVAVLSLVLDDDSPAPARRFVEDPNLFNVMITRARERMVVVTSLTEPPPGLLADWLAQADLPPRAPADVDPGSSWATEIAGLLVDLDVPVRCGYPVGRWRIDLCVGAGEAAIGVECHPHPDGPSAHLERHRALRRAGWRVVDAYPSRYGHRAAEAAIALASLVSPSPSSR